MADTISLVYFSGTGGVARVASAFQVSLERRGYFVNLIPLDFSPRVKHSPDEVLHFQGSMRVILVFAVHAFDAPEPVYRWLGAVSGAAKRTAVISVSAGGEAWPNIGCRTSVITALEARGFEVTYEKMMVMPCNWVAAEDDHVMMHLLNAVPEKTEKILDRFLAGAIRRTTGRLSWLRRKISDMEKQAAKSFPSKIELTGRCTACKWCEQNCPVNNIARGNDGRPRFGGDCVMCFRCVYGCPQEAMRAHDFQVLKQGFSIRALEKRMAGTPLRQVEECCRGFLWVGVRNYLSDRDGY